MSETTTASEKEKKTDVPDQFSDVLLLLDDEKKKISIVKGIKNGEPETVEPKKENSNQFLKVDSRGDIFTNFVSNLISQIKNPTRFRFFRVQAADAEKVANYLENHVRNPTPESEAVMKQYEVSRDKVLQEKKENKNQKQSIMETNQEVKTEQAVNGAETAEDIKIAAQTQTSEGTPGNHPSDETQSEGRAARYKYKPEDVDWTLLNKIGLGQEQLEKMNVLRCPPLFSTEWK